MGFKLNYLLLFLLAFFTFSGVAVARRNYLRLGSVEEIPSEGLKFKGLRKASPNPIKAVSFVPLQQTHIRNNKKTVKKIDAYILREIWLHDQYLGRWTCPEGDLTVYKIEYPVPEDLHVILKKFVLKKDYDDWKQTPSKDWSNEKIQKWLEYLTEKKVDSKPSSVKKGRCNILQYNVENKIGVNELFLVTDSKNPWRRYVFHYEARDASDYEKSVRTTLQSVKSIAMSSPKKTESKQLVTRKSIKKQNKSQEYLASLERVKGSIKNLEGWWYLETENYVFTSNIRKKKMINDMQTQIERCREVYEKFFPLKSPLKEVSVIKVFQKRNEYADYIGGRWANDSIGLWQFMRKELAISPLTSTKSRVSRNQMLSTLYHEGFHQYIFYAANEVNSSVWFNEGHACFFEAFDFKGASKYDLEISMRRYKFFTRMMGARISTADLQELINKDYNQFYDPDMKTMARNYTMAWSVVYFVYKGAPLMKKSKYWKILERYYDSLVESKNPETATKDAWKGIDMDAFVKDYNEFWSNKRLVKRSSNYNMEKLLSKLKSTK